MKLFPSPSVARGLTDKEYHEVNFKNKKHRVRVTPFLNGKITNLKVSIVLEKKLSALILYNVVLSLFGKMLD